MSRVSKSVLSGSACVCVVAALGFATAEDHVLPGPTKDHTVAEHMGSDAERLGSYIADQVYRKLRDTAGGGNVRVTPEIIHEFAEGFAEDFETHCKTILLHAPTFEGMTLFDVLDTEDYGDEDEEQEEEDVDISLFSETCEDVCDKVGEFLLNNRGRKVRKLKNAVRDLVEVAFMEEMSGWICVDCVSVRPGTTGMCWYDPVTNELDKKETSP